MRISELARRSGVSVPTIKYYLRVGLLAPGKTTARNQAIYEESHLRRLRLVRVFVDIGGLSVMATRDVLAAIDDSRVSGEHLLSVIESARAAAARRRGIDTDVVNSTLRDVAALVAQHGWRVPAQGQALDRLADVCVAARLLEMRELCAVLDTYAAAAKQLAECDVAVTRALAARMGDEHRTGLMEAVMAAVVLGNALLTTLRSLARQDALTRLFAEWTAEEESSAESSGASSGASLSGRSPEHGPARDNGATVRRNVTA